MEGDDIFHFMSLEPKQFNVFVAKNRNQRTNWETHKTKFYEFYKDFQKLLQSIEANLLMFDFI